MHTTPLYIAARMHNRQASCSCGQLLLPGFLFPPTLVVYFIVSWHSYSCSDLLGFCARMRSTCSLLYSCLFPFSPLSLLSCNCKRNPNFLRLVCPCLCHEHTQYWQRGLANFHASLCKAVTRTLNFLQIRRREEWPRSGRLSSLTSSGDWEAYQERLEMFLEANAVAEGQRVATLLTVIGGTAYKIVRNFVAPASLKDKTCTELMDALSAHFSSKPLVIAERYRFHKRDQLPGESIATYVAELRRFARHCNFGMNLDDRLRDRLVCGLSNSHIIKKLRRRTSNFPKPFSWLQRRRQPLMMRLSLGRRLFLPRCTSSHLLRVDDRRRSSVAVSCTGADSLTCSHGGVLPWWSHWSSPARLPLQPNGMPCMRQEGAHFSCLSTEEIGWRTEDACDTCGGGSVGRRRCVCTAQLRNCGNAQD